MDGGNLTSVADLDQAGPAAAAAALAPLCASTRWTERLVAARPYRSAAALIAASDAAITALGWPDIEQALAAHPRIGQPPARGRAAGERGTAGHREASWSREEQAAASPGGASQAAELRAGNAAYEQRFGHVFLICATGLTAGEVLAALRSRLGHEATAEREVVRGELRRITALRLAKAFR